jgi:hypothetical protein
VRATQVAVRACRGAAQVVVRAGEGEQDSPELVVRTCRRRTTCRGGATCRGGEEGLEAARGVGGRVYVV